MGREVALVGLDGTPWRRYHVTRDCAQQGAGGLSTFAACTEGLIIMAGYRLGLFQIENVLTAPAAVTVAARVAVRDRLWGGTHHAG
jgi:acyl-coenzyme A synthetase/AMP-(fatty) acid ligase